MKSPPSDLELWACVIDRHILLLVPVQRVTLDLQMLPPCVTDQNEAVCGLFLAMFGIEF